MKFLFVIKFEVKKEIIVNLLNKISFKEIFKLLRNILF